MKKILITGANGFVGSSIAAEAVRCGFETYAGIRQTSNVNSLNDLPVKLFRLDFSSEYFLEEHLRQFTQEEGKFDYIIHNAGITKAKCAEDFEKVNYTFTKNLVNALLKTNSVPEKFIYISSLAAYGPGKGAKPVMEEDVPSPITAYGKSKLDSENFLRSLKNFPALIVRPAAVYGPRDTEFLTLVKVISYGLEPYLGNKGQQLSFIHVTDLAAIIIGLLDSEPGRSFFISDGRAYTNQEFNGLLKKHLRRKTISIVIPKSAINPLAYSMEKISSVFGKINSFNRERAKEFQAANWSCDISPLLKEVSVDFRYDLDTGLEQTIRWYRAAGWIK